MPRTQWILIGQFRLFDQTLFITTTNKESLYYFLWHCDGSIIRQQGWVPNMWCDGCGQEWMCDCACGTIFSHSCDISSPLIWDKMLCKISLTHSLPSSDRPFMRNPHLSEASTTTPSTHDCKYARPICFGSERLILQLIILNLIDPETRWLVSNTSWHRHNVNNNSCRKVLPHIVGKSLPPSAVVSNGWVSVQWEMILTEMQPSPGPL